jgi:hypothetical protein
MFLGFWLGLAAQGSNLRLGVLDFFFKILVCDLGFLNQVIDLIFPSPVVIFGFHFVFLFRFLFLVSLAVPRLLVATLSQNRGM